MTAIQREVVKLLPEIDEECLKERILKVLFEAGRITEDKVLQNNLNAVRQHRDEIDMFVEMTMDDLLQNGYDRKGERPPRPEPEQPRRQPSEQIVVRRRIYNKREPSKQNKSKPSTPLKAVKKVRRVVMKDAIIALEPLEMSSYKVEAKELLANEFKWFTLFEIDRALYLSNDNYTMARQFLQELIEPYIGSSISLLAVNPLNPDYGKDMLVDGDPGRRNALHNDTYGAFFLAEFPRTSKKVSIVVNKDLEKEVRDIDITFSYPSSSSCAEARPVEAVESAEAKQCLDGMVEIVVKENRNVPSEMLADGILKNDPEIVQQALELGADVNEITEDGNTHLLAACSNSSRRIISMLLQQAADVTVCDSIKRTALHLACGFGNFDAVSVLLRCPKIEVNAQDDQGATPLHMAVYYKHRAIADLLMARGADDSIEDMHGISPSELQPKIEAAAADI